MLSLLPIFVYLFLVKLLDNFRVVNLRMFAYCCLAGIVGCGLIVATNLFVPIDEDIIPLLSELMKCAFIFYLIAKRKVVFFAEALCYGAAIGAGFAFAENLVYTLSDPPLTMMQLAFRGFSTSILQMGCTALFGVSILCFNKYACFIAIVGIHYLYNMFLLPEWAQFIITISVFAGLFLAISWIDVQRIYRWMDVSINHHIQLLVAIKEGRLADTPTGFYLEDIKDHMTTEVFFDLICYMQIYLELVIKGKSRMLLVQAQLDQPMTPEEEEEIATKKAEFKSLSKSIGVLGRHILTPILRFDPEDVRFIE